MKQTHVTTFLDVPHQFHHERIGGANSCNVEKEPGWVPRADRRDAGKRQWHTRWFCDYEVWFFYFSRGNMVTVQAYPRCLALPNPDEVGIENYENTAMSQLDIASLSEIRCILFILFWVISVCNQQYVAPNTILIGGVAFRVTRLAGWKVQRRWCSGRKVQRWKLRRGAMALKGST